MQTTSNYFQNSLILDKSETLIASLKIQPLIVVIRANENELDEYHIDKTLKKIDLLYKEGIRNFELGWSSHPNWITFASNIIKEFSTLSFGVASIKNESHLKEISKLNFLYSISPIWNQELQLAALNQNTLLSDYLQ